MYGMLRMLRGITASPHTQNGSCLCGDFQRDKQLAFCGRNKTFAA